MRISDWSSDVCSSDLKRSASRGGLTGKAASRQTRHLRVFARNNQHPPVGHVLHLAAKPTCAARPSPYVGNMVPPAPSLPKDFSQLSLAEAAELLVARKLPPVEQWHPERTGDSAMEIRADGSWCHEGGGSEERGVGKEGGRTGRTG